MRRRYQGLGDLPPGIVSPEQGREAVPSMPPDSSQRSDKIPVYESGKPVVYQKTIGTSSQRVLRARDDRVAIEFFNTGTGTVYVNYGAVASVGAIPIIAGSPGYYSPPVGPTEDIYMIAGAAGQTVVIVEYTRGGTAQ